MTELRLRLAPELVLPADAVAQTLVVYGGKGMGKTNFGTVLAEELARVHARFAVLDPVGNWWGLRHAADGRNPGVELLILGGRHGDIPIEPTAGAVCADLVADEDANVLIDVSRRADGAMWSVGDKVRFVGDYCARLFARQGETMRPLMQILDEAGRFVPQQIPHGAVDIAKCVGAVEQLVEVGRNVGVGTTLITQRSARMNKSVSELAECMVAFRTVGPRSIDAILDWFGEHVPKERWKALLEQLRKLPRGEALVVSPGWLEFEGTAQIRERRTYDTSATPTAAARREPGQGAKPDLAKYRERMAATIEKAKADDPLELRRRIAELEGKLRTKATHNLTAQVPSQPKRVEVEVVKPAMVQEVRRAVAALEAISQRGEAFLERAQAIFEGFREGHARLGTAALQLAGALQARLAPQPAPARSDQVRAQQHGTDWRKIVARPPAVMVSRHSAPDDTGLGAGERKMLEALALRHPESLSKAQLGLLAGYAASGGTFRTYLPRLHRAGLVDVRDDHVALTPAGRASVGEFRLAAQTPEQVRAMWLGALDQGPRRMLEVLITAYPKALTKAELGDASGYEAAGGTFRTYLPKLRRLGLVDVDHDQVRAREALFS